MPADALGQPQARDQEDPSHSGLTAVVLAAGTGTRMRSRLPKLLHPVADRPIVLHVLHAIHAAGIRDVVIVTGHEEEAVRAAALQHGLDALTVRFAHQADPLGTGHAALQARAAVGADQLLVINGDAVLATADHLRALVDAAPCRVALATANVADPTRLGRIVRHADGTLQAIVEEADADEPTRAIAEINVGIYRFDAQWLWTTLEALPPSAGGEIYLTDAVAQAVADGQSGALPVLIDTDDASLTVETRRDLATAEATLRRRIADHWLDRGVTIADPATTYISADACVGEDTVIEPGSHLRGATVIGRDCRIGPNTVLRDVRAGTGCDLRQCSITEAILGDRVDVGPFSTIRPGSVLDDDVHIGTHAETKSAHLHRGVRMGHFSYVGDAEVGAETNIGAGAITCNFDGQTKHRTVIGERVFIGSDSLLIAPLTIGDGASTGAGSVVNKDVAPGQRVVGHPARRRRTENGDGA